jgi:CHAT domain-containing protein
LYRELAARRFQLEARLDRAGTEDTRVRLLRKEIAGLRQQIDQVNAQFGAAAAQAPESQGGRRKDLDLGAIPANTALVEYWLGAEETTAWVATREGLQMLSLGPTARISSQALAFRTSLRSFGTVPVAERLRLGEELYRLIIQPLVPLLLNKRQLLFAPDGALHYVPFAALRAMQGGRNQFLIEQHEVAVAASLTSLLSDPGVLPGPGPPLKQMLLVDDPVYGLDDPRLSIVAGAPAQKSVPAWLIVRGAGGSHALPRLPGSQREADTIASLLPGDAVDRLEGFAATRERFLAANLGRYRFIHVASHAVTDPEIPQLSALILTSRDARGAPVEGRVLAADFMSTQLNAEAVVLSACDTALGKNLGGEGLVGLRYVVLARGARSVLASLWQVPDEAATQLMSRFYSSLLQGRSGVIVSSSEAMRGMLAGGVRDPALWAAFAVAVGPLNTPINPRGVK